MKRKPPVQSTKKPRPRSYIEHFCHRFTDARTTDGRRLKAYINGLKKDLGGEDSLNQAQRIILDCLPTKIIIIWKISLYMDDNEGEVVSKNGRLMPVLRTDYNLYSESIRRDLETLYLMRRSVKHSDYEKAIKDLQGGGA